jgi:prepilin-type processing-associated H-X9-DG protein
LRTGVARHSGAAAFTIIELVVVIGVITLLIALLLPTLRRVRESAKASTCTGNQRQIMLAMRMYAQENEGRLPYQAVDFRDWSGELAQRLKIRGAVFQCPADDAPRRKGFEDLVPRSYAVNSGEFTSTDGYRTPWPKDRHERPGHLHKIPLRIFVVGENNGGGYASGAAVGIAEAESLGGAAWGVHYRGGKGAGDNYAFSDGHVEFRRKSEIDQWPAGEDSGGSLSDPWKWRP